MNGPFNVYKTRVIIRHDEDVLVPDNMYKMKNIHSIKNGPLGDHVSPFENTVDISMQGLDDQPELVMLEERLRKILRELGEIQEDMIKLKGAVEGVDRSEPKVAEVPNLSEIVINASPSYPPYALLIVQKLCSGSFNLIVSTHLHSTVSALSLEAESFVAKLKEFRSQPNLPNIFVRLIWKNVGASPELTVTRLPIGGEPNILRYLARLLPTLLKYESSDNVVDLDSVLDISYCLVRSKNKTERATYLQMLSKKLGKSPFLCGHSEITIADIAACSAIKQVAQTEINQNMNRWFLRCQE